MNHGAVIYLNHNQAVGAAIGRTELPRDYILACRFLHCGIIDRTRTLDTGFISTVLDDIPAPTDGPIDFGALCDARGVDIVTEASVADRPIDVLWSGGIDSTTALTAVIKATIRSGCPVRVRVLLSMDSVLEHPQFFLDHIRSHLAVRSIAQPISAYLDPARLTITGEHGDQLVGSQLLEPWVRRGLAGEDYREVLPVAMLERLRNPLSAWRALRYLTPVLEAAPVPLHSLFDAMWWLNFSLKWQDVTLRLPAMTGDAAGPVYRSVRHFFRTDGFQQWAMGRSESREVGVWARYKEESKRYILDFTGDERYYQHKEKEDSLRRVINLRQNPERFQIFMRDDFRPIIVGIPRPSIADASSGRMSAVSRQLGRVLNGS